MWAAPGDVNNPAGQGHREGRGSPERPDDPDKLRQGDKPDLLRRPLVKPGLRNPGELGE